MGVKLVRDNTEAMVQPMGVSGRWYEASDEELLPAMCRKLLEEALEFQEDKNPMELWDTYDVLMELIRRYDASSCYQEHLRKIDRFGLFSKGIMWDPVPGREDA